VNPAIVATAKKDARALLPAWFAAVVAQSTAALAPGGDWYSWDRFALLTYCATVIGMGAIAVGHEYTHGTVSSLLTLPIRRSQLLWIRFTVDGGLILSLGALVWTLRLVPSPQVVALPLLGAFFVAPWFTMLCRNPLGGAVFTVAVPALLFLGFQVIAAVAYGSTPEASGLALTWWYCAIAVMLPLTAALGWRQFMHLEALEGPGQPIHLPNWMRVARETRSRHSVWMLVKKELSLHQMAFVVAGLYVLAWMAVFPFGVLPEAPGRTITLMPVTAIYFLILALVIGSMTSAEERQYGTREWHLILPMAAWRQWVIKVGVALALAVTLGVALPWGLWFISGTAEEQRIGGWVWRGGIIPVIVLTVHAIYVSSSSVSGLRALFVALPTISAPIAVVQAINPYTFGRARVWAPTDRQDAVILACAASLLLLLLWFGFTNHTTEPSKRRLAGQLAIVAVVVALAIALVSLA
jgi:hypothetical protein